MKNAEIRGRHLTDDEVLERVFPSGEDPAPVPMHLAVCTECQGKVARLRESWLLDRGAVAGVVESQSEAFWQAQGTAVMQKVLSEAASAPMGVRPIPFSLQRSFLRRPVLAFGSLAAALALVAGLSRLPIAGGASAPDVARLQPAITPVAALAPDDRSDDELLLDIDHVLAEDGLTTILSDGIS